MQLLSRRAAEGLRAALERSAYAQLFSEDTHHQINSNPWTAFTAARLSGQTQAGDLRILVRLFLLGDVAIVDAVASVLGPAAVEDLCLSGFLVRSGGFVSSPFCVLVVAQQYVIIQYPAASGPIGKWVAATTYFGNSTIELLVRVERFLPAARFMEIGCGIALSAIFAAKRGARAFGVDIDEVALRLAAANVQLNMSSVQLIAADLVSAVGRNSAFDLIAFNPPWRLMATTVAYPNPTARVGLGRDGLDSVRRFLRTAPDHLGHNGIAVVRADLPCSTKGICPFLSELPELVQRDGVSINVDVFGYADITTQARESAVTASFLNLGQSIDNLAALFEQRYAEINCSGLWRCFVEVTNDAARRFSIQRPSAN
jgi:methylase of polypeptide subunit release factors